MDNFIFISLFYKYFYSSQTEIATGIGLCAGANAARSTSLFYICGSGPNCNNFANKTCWNPVTGTTSTATCSASDWQCAVIKNHLFS